MTTYMTRPILLSLVLVCATLVACNKPGPAEEAGREIDESTERASKAFRNKLDKVEDSLKEKDQDIDTEVSDADITTKVKMELMKHDGLNSLTISVKTQSGGVTLSGSVVNEAQFKLAEQLALAVDDVTSVANNLSIVSPAQ